MEFCSLLSVFPSQILAAQGQGAPGAAPTGCRCWEASPRLGSFAHQGLCATQGTVSYQHLLRMESHPKVKFMQLPPQELGVRVPEEPSSSPGTPSPLTAPLQPGEQHRVLCHEEVPQGSPSAPHRWDRDQQGKGSS